MSNSVDDLKTQVPPADAPYRNPNLPTAQRVADLVSRMTLAEKAGQMLQLNAKDGVADYILNMHAGSILHTSPARVIEAAELTKQTRLQIPLLVADDAIHGHSFWEGATIFPTQLSMAASWNADLIEQVARATAREVAATGLHWTFSPVLCIARDLRWGRVSETFGEDPFLIGEFASAMVRGYQGDGLTDPTSILACAKHFAAYSETQGGRDASEADISQRKMRSWFLPPFERVAREGSATFMLGYQSTDGVPITINDWLLNDVLRGEWGYEGTLITDWDNTGRMVWEQHIFPDYTQASAAAVNAGNDMIMTTPNFFEGAQRAVEQGLIREEQLDAAVSRILTVKFDLGLFEDPRLPSEQAQAQYIYTPEHQRINLDIARRSIVLLQNDGTLPLLPAGAEGENQKLRIAVVGPNADDAQTQLGDWAGNSGQVDWMPEGQPREMITTVLDGLRELSPAGSEITYAQGARILDEGPNPDGEFFPDGQPRPLAALPVSPDDALISEAVAAAENSDVVVAVVGDRIELVGETKSTATLDLFGDQIALLEALAATGKPMIVVLIASKPHVLPKSVQEAAAILWAGNPGMVGGQAIAEILLGKIEPSGRLPISFAVHVGQQPTYYNQIKGQHGTRYADLTQQPAFAFGQGLSYTTVEYSNLEVLTPELSSAGVTPAGYAVNTTEEQYQEIAAGNVPADHLHARVTLRNTGSRPVVETVQAYLRDVVFSVTWANRELKGYRQVELAPGEEKVVDLVLPVSAMTLVNARGERIIEPGEFQILVGPDSREESLLVGPFTVS